jgi:hypothetical protein
VSDASGQLAWLEYMERVEQEVFPDARPRSEIEVVITEFPPAHPSAGASGAPEPEPPRNRGKAAGVDGLTALGQEDAPSA